MLCYDCQEQYIKCVIGLLIVLLFLVFKMCWLLDVIVDGYLCVECGEICFGIIDSWLLWNLIVGEVFCCDYFNVFCIQLLNLYCGEWDDEMLVLFGILCVVLLEIKLLSGFFGYIKGLVVILDGILIMLMIGDFYVVLFGYVFGEVGCVKVIYGIGFLVMVLVKLVQCDIDVLVIIVVWYDGDQLVWGLEGNIFYIGDVVVWMVDSIGLSEFFVVELVYELNIFFVFVDLIFGVYFVLVLIGFGVFWWDDSVCGVICGLSCGVKCVYLICVVLEFIIYQIVDVVVVMCQYEEFILMVLMVDGGLINNDWLM